jgi:FkbM family methyltransferase
MTVFLQSLKKSGHLDRLHMTVCNVGSRKLGNQDDYASQGWGIFAPQLTIYGFDADDDACAEANANLEARQVNWKEVHIPLALGKSVEERTLYVTKAPMCSSLYPPNEPYLKRLAGLSELVNLDFSFDIETTTLDNFCESESIDEIDFLQIDVQGADLDVLQGATKILDSVLAIQIEVEFSHLYINQPLFADVDSFLRKNGFTLFDISSAYRLRANSPIRSTVRPGQLLWGDAFYFRDPLQNDIPLLNPDRIFKLACIADIMNFPDYALELLEYLTLNYGKDPNYNFANNIVEGLAQFPELINNGLNTLPTVAKINDYISNLDISSFLPSEPSQLKQIISPIRVFQSDHYMRHNQRRLEHLASLNLGIHNTSVLEVGAGIGDHSSYFVDRGCRMVITEGRPENLDVLKSRYPELDIRHLDMESPDSNMHELFDIVYCYGLLYHLNKPKEAIEFMSQHCQNMLLLETCVSFGTEESINPVNEPADSPTQAVSGEGCRPTRIWIYNQLKQYFEFVYMPITQPNHEEFPLTWEQYPTNNGTLTRSVFIASRQKLQNDILVEGIPMIQRRH